MIAFFIAVDDNCIVESKVDQNQSVQNDLKNLLNEIALLLYTSALMTNAGSEECNQRLSVEIQSLHVLEKCSD